MKIIIHWGIWDRNNRSDPARHAGFARSLQRNPQPLIWYLVFPYTHRWVRSLTKTFPESIYLGKYQCQPVMRHWGQTAAPAARASSICNYTAERWHKARIPNNPDWGAQLGCRICIFKFPMLLSIWDRDVNLHSLNIPQPWLPYSLLHIFV